MNLIPKHERRHMLCCCRKKAACAFTAGSRTLSDLIHEVPRLLEMLDSKSLVALMSTNSVHNTQIHNLVTCLTIHSAKGVTMLSPQLWPLLTGLSLKFSTGASDRSLRGLLESWLPNPHAIPEDSAALQHLVQANLSNLQSLSLTGTLSVAAQANLCKASWPNMRRLRLTHASLTDETLRVMTAAQGDLIKDLFCSGTKSTAAQAVLSNASRHDMGISHLTHAALTDEIYRTMTPPPWALLEELDLSSNKLSQDAIHILHARPWPKLRQLNLSDNDDLYGLTFLVLARKNDSIRQWPVLQALHLSGARMGRTFALPLLQKASWPQLKSLTLTTNTTITVSLNSIEMRHLVQAGMSSLEKLDFTKYWLDDAGASQLSKGKWPKLRQLKASGAARDLVPHIVRGKWPLLEALDIGGFSLDDFALHELTRGHWPLLQHLRASAGLYFVAAHCNIDLAFHTFRRVTQDSVISPDVTLDCMPQLLQERWPMLRKVVLNPCKG